MARGEHWTGHSLRHAEDARMAFALPHLCYSTQSECEAVPGGEVPVCNECGVPSFWEPEGMPRTVCVNASRLIAHLTTITAHGANSTKRSVVPPIQR